MENILKGLAIAAGSLLMGIGVRKMIKIHSARKAQRLKLDQYDPAECILHSTALKEIQETQVFLKKAMSVNIQQQYAYLIKRRGGKTNGEQQKADEALQALILEHTELI